MKLFNHVLEARLSARWPWSHFKVHELRDGRFGPSYGKHIVWGKLSITFGQPHLLPITVCADCYEQIETKSAGDESWSYCESCQQVEGNTLELTTEEYEAHHG